MVCGKFNQGMRGGMETEMLHLGFILEMIIYEVMLPPTQHLVNMILARYVINLRDRRDQVVNYK